MSVELNSEVNSSERVAEGFFEDGGKGKNLLSTIKVDTKVEIEKNEAGENRRIEKQYFDTEFVEAQKGCNFSNCLHENEPDCRVKDLLITDEISMSRFDSYISMLEELKGYKDL